jgi:hypothetical protein
MQPRMYVLLVLAVFTVVCFVAWAPTFDRPHTRAIGEAYLALQGAENFDRYGFRYAGLQDISWSVIAANHPVLYIHHPNFGLYVSHALYQSGVTSFAAQNAISFAGTLLGLVLAYLFALRLTRSEWFALGFMALLAFNAEFIVNWAFNIHRAFTYASLFGTMYACFRWAELDFRSWLWGAISVFASITLIGTDYMFYFWTLLALISSYALFLPRRTAIKGAVIVVGLFGFVFALRQLQVAIGIGPAVWAGDFTFQILNRLGLSAWYPHDWMAKTTAFYKTHRVINPGFSGTVSPFERAYHLTVGTGEGLLYGIGDFTPHKRVALAVGALLGAITASAVYFDYRTGKLSAASRFGLMFVLPCIGMAIVFPALFVLWNRAFLLPHICVAAWIMTALAWYLRPRFNGEAPALRAIGP